MIWVLRMARYWVLAIHNGHRWVDTGLDMYWDKKQDYRRLWRSAMRTRSAYGHGHIDGVVFDVLVEALSAMPYAHLRDWRI